MIWGSSLADLDAAQDWIRRGSLSDVIEV
jgi:hypothetical protein